MSVEGGAPRARLVTRPFALVTLSAFAYFTSYAMLIPALPRYVEGPLGGGKVAVGIAIGAFGITALVLRPFVGALGDRRGRRMLMLGGTAGVAASGLALVWADTLPLVIVLRLLSGAGEAFMFVGAASAITDMAPPERRGEALSLFSIALYSGVAAGPYLAEVLLDVSGFDAVFAAAAALALVAFGFALPTPDTRPDQPPDAPPVVRRVLHPAGIFPGLVMLTSVWGFAGYMAFVALYADELGLAGARGLLLMYGLIMVAIRLFGARIPDRYGAELVGKVGLAGSMTGLAIIGLSGTVAGLFAGTVVFAGGQALAFPAFMALAATSAPPAERGAAVGTTTAFIDLGFFIGPVSLGAVAAGFDTQAAFLGGAVVAAVGLAFQISVGRARRREVAPAPAES